MKFNVIVLIVLLSLLTTGCFIHDAFFGQPEFINKTKIYQQQNKGWTSLHEYEVVDDYVRIGDSIFCGELGCDANAMQGIDLSSFRVWAGSKYAIDKQNVYYPLIVICEDNIDCGVCYCARFVVEDANPATFAIRQDGFATDDRNVFYKGILLEGANRSTIRHVNELYATDSQYVYYKGASMQAFDEGSILMKGLNGATFKYLGKNYASDGNIVYYKHELMEEADGATFKVFDEPKYFTFALDKNNVYLHHKIFVGADPASFYFDRNDKRNDEKNRKFIVGDKDNEWEYEYPARFKKIVKQ